MGNWTSYHPTPPPQIYARNQLNACLQDRLESVDPWILDMLQNSPREEAVRFLNENIDEWTRVLAVRDVILLRHIKHAKSMLSIRLQRNKGT